MQILNNGSKDELLKSFQIMLEEAGARPTANDAIAVIAGILQDISIHNQEIEPLSKLWSDFNRCLARQEVA